MRVLHPRVIPRDAGAPGDCFTPFTEEEEATMYSPRHAKAAIKKAAQSLSPKARAAVIAGAVLASGGGLALASAGAGAATGTAHAYSKDISGYQTTGRWVRYIDVSVKLPSNDQCAQVFQPHSPQGDGFAITLGPAEESDAGVPQSAGDASTLGVSFVPGLSGCGLISPSFASNLPGGAPQFGAVGIDPGDTVELSLYYDKGATFTQAIVVDHTNGHSAHLNFDGKATYVNASAVAGFGAYAPAGAKVKLWAPKPAAVTTYTGKHGSLASFAPQQVIMTSDGTPAGATYAWPGALWGGSNFSVFGR